MDECSLRDVGLTRYDALYEARKPFWGGNRLELRAKAERPSGETTRRGI
jgi:hypothetical protein